MNDQAQKPKHYKVDMTSETIVKDGGLSFSVYRVVTEGIGNQSYLICAFYGPSAYAAAHQFCETLNNNPIWNQE